jgi:hypothetical protein
MKYIMTRWTDHIKEFAKKKGIGYGCALSDPDVKKGYVPAGDKKRKPEKLVQAMPSTEPKPKNIVIKPRPAGAGIPIFRGMNEKEIALTKALKGYYTAQDNDTERYVKFNKRGEITGDNKKELKGLTDDLAAEFKLPKTWLKQADKVADKYGLGYGTGHKEMFYRTKE